MNSIPGLRATQGGVYYLSYLWIQMHWKNDMNMGVRANNVDQGMANILESLSEIFPSMGSDQDDSFPIRRVKKGEKRCEMPMP